MKKATNPIPWLLLMAVAAWLVSDLVKPAVKTDSFQLDEAATLLVSGDGRVKPLDTVARAALIQISGKQTVKLDDQRVSAMQWLLDVMTESRSAPRYEIFEITHPDVLGLMGIKQTTQKRFSINDIQPHAVKLNEQIQSADAVNRDPTRQINAAQRHLLQLASKINIYQSLALGDSPYAVPPLTDSEQWQPRSVALAHFNQTGDMNQACRHLHDILHAYHENNPSAFNAEVSQYNALLQKHFPSEFRRARIEILYNHYAPFYKGTVIYFGTFLLACMALLMYSFRSGQWAQTLRRSAMLLILLTFALHTAAIIVRIYLHGRPPVTNLYSSAVFIGWACVPLGLAVELFMKRLSLGLIVASLAGFVTLIIAHYLALEDGDTMKNMQAVLDTNFWLATHVPTVTIGYAATFLAGLLAVVYILLGVGTPLLTKDVRRDFAKAVYGVICFAMLLSFVGTVLGGIWADQSWGRFWGWDPKENGAVLIVLINALILHARWGGVVRERGMMVLAVLGNIITAWSWFGTNMLGVGFHSYGFVDNGRLLAMWGFVIFHLIIMGVGCLPQRLWMSHSDAAATKPNSKRKLASAQA